MLFTDVFMLASLFYRFGLAFAFNKKEFVELSELPGLVNAVRNPLQSLFWRNFYDFRENLTATRGRLG